MKKSIFQKRLNILRERMSGIKPDTLWIIQPENRRYLSGFRAVDLQLNESSGSLIINKDKALLITDSRYTSEAQKEAYDFEVITIKNNLMEDLPTILASLKTRVFGFEGEYISWEQHSKLTKTLKSLSPSIKAMPLNGLVDTMREIKDRSEIEAMELSAAVMARILDAVIGGLQPGSREKDIAWEIERLARETGAEGMAFPPIVASGPNSALPHAVPTERTIRPQEPIIFDVGLRFNGYCCDMTRTIFLGTPGRTFKKVYHVVREAQHAALRQIRAGMSSTQLDGIARKIIGDAGFGDYFGHALGHGVGLATHENPRIGPKKPITLHRGMICTIEPGIYLPGKGGVRLEEMVEIERDGARILTKAGHFYDFS